MSNPPEPSSADMSREKSGRGTAGERFPKTDPKHWENKIYRHTYEDGGRRTESKTYSVRIAFRGARHSLNLGVGEKRAAAKLAKEIYLQLLNEGWAPVLRKYRAADELAQLITVGAYIQAAEKVFTKGPRTFADYSRSLRQIAASVAGVASDTKRFGPGKGGAALWRQKVDAVGLSALTVPNVSAWMKSHIDKGKNPEQRERRKRGANSILRMARALFGRQILKSLANEVLPDPLPFAGVEYESAKMPKYRSVIDARELLVSAAGELADKDPEAWKAIIMTLAHGLRKREVDCLAWSQFDFVRNIVRVTVTEHANTKSDESDADIDLDPDFVPILKALQKRAHGKFYLESPLAPRPDSARAFYRAAQTWDRLTTWLRKHGVTARKPVHELRKELGAIVTNEHGIYAAQRVLRHARVSTTEAHYVDKKRIITGGLGKALSEPPGAP
jgi:hypothetical protein